MRVGWLSKWEASLMMCINRIWVKVKVVGSRSIDFPKWDPDFRSTLSSHLFFLAHPNPNEELVLVDLWSYKAWGLEGRTPEEASSRMRFDFCNKGLTGAWCPQYIRVPSPLNLWVACDLCDPSAKAEHPKITSSPQIRLYVTSPAVKGLRTILNHENVACEDSHVLTEPLPRCQVAAYVQWRPPEEGQKHTRPQRVATHFWESGSQN